MARKLSVGDVKLTEHVARRKRHQVQIGWIPGRHNDSSILWRVLDFVNAILQLVDSLVGVIAVHIGILRTEMAPLQMTAKDNNTTFGCIHIHCILCT